MWNGNAGDYIWDFINELVDNEKKEDQVKEEVMTMLNNMIRRNRREFRWLEKIKRMIELEENNTEEEDLCWGEKGQ